MPNRRVLATLAVIGVTLGAAACGGSSGRDAGTTTGHAARGGHLTALASSDIDSADPGRVYSAYGYMVQYAVNRTLYSYGPGDSLKARPDLAAGDARVSRDLKTITVTLKPGIRYAPPVDREVTSKDVKYAFERAFSANVQSPYASVYFKDLVGAPAKPGAIRDIPGIQTPDDHTIVFRLRTATAPFVTQALAMPISTPVPEEYARRFDAKSPSTYDQHVAFTGPYRIERHVPDKVIELARNPNWDRKTDYRPAYLDAITIQEGNDDAVSAARRVLDGESMILGDGPAPAPVLKEALADHRAQVASVPGGQYRFVSMNSTVKPFNNVDVRRAVVAAADRTALQLSRGGQSVGELATHFLPPAFPGFDAAGGKQGTGADFLAHPHGDLALARRYMLAAKKSDPSLPIDGSGMWTGDAPLLMVATNADPGKKTGEVAQAQFEKLGFKVKFRTAPLDAIYTKFCAVPATKIAICPNFSFVRDFNDGQALLAPVFDGRSIAPANNVNWSQLDDPGLNAAIAKARTLPAGPGRDRAWGAVDRLATAQAPGIPYLWDTVPIVEAANVRGVVNQYATGWDLSFTSLK